LTAPPAQRARLACIAFVAFFLLSQRGMTRERATWPVLLVAAFLVAGTAAAQVKTADLANATLEELMNIPVTTATRASETLANAPARMQVITEEQIRTRGYRSLMDLLEDFPDFKVDRAGDQDYPTELTVQGTRGASRVIVLLDGIRVSSPTNEPLPILANYPVHAAKQIEIVYGPVSAVYGADAFSGVINIISRNGKESPGLAVTSAAGQDGLYNQSASYGTHLGKNGSLLIGGQFYYDRQPDLSKVYPRDFNGLQGQQTGTFNTIFGPMQSPLPVSRDYEAPISAWSFQTLFEHGGTQLSLFANNARVPTSPAYTPDNAVYNDAAFNDNDLLVVSGSHTRMIRRVASTSTITFSRHELDPQSGYWNVFSNMTKSYKYAYGSMLKFDEQLVWKPATKMTLAAGATFERFFAIPQGADLDAPITSRDVPGMILGTNIPDDFVKLRYSNTGAYAQWQYAATPSLALTFGARGDYNTRYGGTFNPRVGLVLNTDNDTTLKLLYGTAYLAPSPYEAYSHYGSFYSTDGGETYASDYWHLPNPDLRPQQKKTVEANVLQVIDESFVVSASAFYSSLTDLRLPADPDRAYSGFYHGWPVAYIDFAVNEGSARTYGATLALDFATSFAPDRRMRARGALSLADGRILSQVASLEAKRRIPIGGMSPVEARFGADIEWGRWTVAPRLAISGRQRLQATDLIGENVVRKTLDGYALFDVNIRRRQVLTHVDLFLTLDNALDARYRHINVRAYTNPEELIGAPQNPRRVTLGVEIRVPQ
jgi:outer membrane cobalamin receptor